MENTYQQLHKELHLTIRTAINELIKEFGKATGGKVTRIEYKGHGVWDVSTTLTPTVPPRQLIANDLQRRLDLLDEAIDTLQREKEAAGDDLSIIDEAKHRHQQARQIFSRGDIVNALGATYYAELCVATGQRELESYQKMGEAIEAVFRSKDIS